MRLFADQEDERHGEYKVAQVKQPDGSVREIEVTEKWLIIQKLKKEQAVAPHDWIQANFIGPYGERIEIRKIGQGIDRDTVSDLRDPDTGQVYGFYLFKAGNEEIHLTTKAIYDEMKDQMARMQPFIDSEVRHMMYGEESSES